MSVVPDREAAAQRARDVLANPNRLLPVLHPEFELAEDVLALSERLVVLERERDEARQSNEALKAHRATIQGVVGRAERAEVRLREIARLSEECDGTDHARILREIDAVLDGEC